MKRITHTKYLDRSNESESFIVFLFLFSQSKMSIHFENFDLNPNKFVLFCFASKQKEHLFGSFIMINAVRGYLLTEFRFVFDILFDAANSYRVESRLLCLKFSIIMLKKVAMYSNSLRKKSTENGRHEAFVHSVVCLLFCGREKVE